jgi:transglutaminase-like putative cysteine protease
LSHLGVPQELSTELTARLGPEGGLDSFSYRIGSGPFTYLLEGKTDRGGILVYTAGKQEEAVMLPVPSGRPVFLSALWPGFLGGEDWPPGQERVFSIMDPTGPAIRQLLVTYEGPEMLVMGQSTLPVKKYSLNFSGIIQKAWVGTDGEILRETGPLDLVIEKAPAGWQPQELPDLPRRDLAGLAAVTPTGLPIKNGDDLRKLTLRVGALRDTRLQLEGGRQTLAGDNLLVVREDHPDFISRKEGGEDGRNYLQANPFLQVEHPEIKRALAKMVRPEDPPSVKARKIVAWVYDNIEKKPVFSLPDALQTLRLKAGDCNEHAQLVAALGRAAGIPTGIEIGLAYQQGRFYYHAWNVFYLDRWITADATRGSLPAAVTNIRLWRTQGEVPLEMLGLIGQIKLEVLKAEK